MIWTGYGAVPGREPEFLPGVFRGMGDRGQHRQSCGECKTRDHAGDDATESVVEFVVACGKQPCSQERGCFILQAVSRFVERAVLNYFGARNSFRALRHAK